MHPTDGPLGRTADSLNGSSFETEVRRVAEILYPTADGGATFAGGEQERDGVYVTEDAVILIEATTSLAKEKAEKDARKLKVLADQLAKKYPYKAVKALFVTQADPTAHQRDAVTRVGGPVTAIGFSKFKARLIDSRAYLEARTQYAFGSARDPETDDVRVTDEYVGLDFRNIESGQSVNLESLMECVRENARTVIIGEFGAGKSMTLREIYLRLRAAHLKNSSEKFCIHLNLTDHQGQTDPAEALIRHASRIGFSSPHQLVRAWRAADAHIVLDGFDEVSTVNWVSRRVSLVEVRRRSVELIRRFILDTPKSSAVIVAGREHFFNGIEELRTALSIRGGTVISATDFTEEQVAEYLERRKWSLNLPPWLPRRPLIVGYLAGRRLFDHVDLISEFDQGEGWDRLLEEISNREARPTIGIDADSVRRIIERLATLARRTTSGLGPLEFEDLANVYLELSGYFPEEEGYALLQRLPGLRVADTQSNTRTFIDDDLVDAARAGDVLRWIENPVLEALPPSYRGWTSLLGYAGMAVLQHKIENLGIPRQAVQQALLKLQRTEDVEGLRADLVRLLLSVGSNVPRPVVIQDVHIPTLVVSPEGDARNVTFSGCVIDLLDLEDSSSADVLPMLVNCAVDTVSGVTGLDEFVHDRVEGTSFVNFPETSATSSAILRLNISDWRRVTLTLLKKIYTQGGSARKESGLYRGSLTMAQRELIPRVLDELKTEGFVRSFRRRDTDLWEPNRALSSRVRAILEQPTQSRDPILRD